MTDCFALLGEPRRPWLETAALQEKFLALAARFHPDRTHDSPAPEQKIASDKFAELNAAHNRLRDPKQRIGHLLELELGAKPPEVHEAPAEMTDFCFEAGRLCRQAGTFNAAREKVTSPVSKVQWFVQAHEWIERLRAFQRQIADRQAALHDELKSLNPAWAAADSAARDGLPLNRLAEIHRRLGFLGRWADEIQERIAQLTF